MSDNLSLNKVMEDADRWLSLSTGVGIIRKNRMNDIETYTEMQEQMDEQIENYRSLLRHILGYFEGTNQSTASEILHMIRMELRINSKRKE